MYTLPIPPDSQGFTVDEGNTNTSIQLDGGAPRIRADQLGAVKTANCQWTLKPANFDYMMAFYRTAAGFGANPFLISLVGIDSAEATTYTAWFVPGTFKPILSQSGLTYVISAQLWVLPSSTNTANDAAILVAGPQ